MAAKPPVNDFDIEAAMGRLLRIGVLAAAFIVLTGSTLYLWEHGFDRVDHHEFLGEPSALTNPGEILQRSLRLESRSVIQLGLVLLILTPIVRIVFSIVGFFLEKDYLYVLIGAIVLTIILLSTFGAGGI
jgi:uncharacterized membrane protein